jgi:type I restriction enzyme, S subunit
MKQTWHKKPLKDVAPSKSAKFPAVDETVWNLSLEEIESGTGKVLREVSSKVSELGSSKTSFDERNVLYSKLRPYLNKVVVPDKSGVGTSELIPLFPNPEILDREFLAFYLRSPKFLEFANANTQGTNLPRVSMANFWQHEIEFPEIEEQWRIVGRIKECLSRVDEIKHLREESRKEANSLEEAIFGDFLEDAQRDGCEVVNLGDVLTKSQYGTSAKATADGKGFPVLRMGNIKSGHFDFSDLKYMELSDAELEKYRLNVGDILINRTNSLELVGKSAVFQKEEGDWVFASYLVRLVVDSSKAIPEFVNASINSRIGRAYVYATARRAIGMVNINAKEIAKMPLPLPSLEKQAQIVSQIKEARIASQSLLEELDIKAIESLPNSILRKAFAGEL